MMNNYCALAARRPRLMLVLPLLLQPLLLLLLLLLLVQLQLQLAEAFTPSRISGSTAVSRALAPFRTPSFRATISEPPPQHQGGEEQHQPEEGELAAAAVAAPEVVPIIDLRDTCKLDSQGQPDCMSELCMQLVTLFVVKQVLLCRPASLAFHV